MTGVLKTAAAAATVTLGLLAGSGTTASAVTIDFDKGVGGSSYTEDGFTVTGIPARLRGGRIESRGDHRIAMLGAVAGLASRDGVRVEGADAVAVSFPGFFDVVERLRRSTRNAAQWRD